MPTHTWTFEVSCIKWMEKSEVIQKCYSENIGWYLFLVSIDFTTKYKIKQIITIQTTGIM